jgi:hypothetical protein
MNLDPEQVLNIFAKNVDTSFAGAIPNSLLARQDLESEIVKLTNRNTPLRDMVKRTRGEGRAHLWNQRVALGHLPGNNSPLEIFYKDGALPTQSDPQYVQKTAAYAYLGVTGVAYSIAPVKSGCIGETPSNVGNTEATWETRESVETNTPDSNRMGMFWSHALPRDVAVPFMRLLKIESDTPSDRRNTQNYRPDDKPKAVIVKSRCFGETPQSRAIPSQPAQAESA